MGGLASKLCKVGVRWVLAAAVRVLVRVMCVSHWFVGWLGGWLAACLPDLWLQTGALLPRLAPRFALGGFVGSVGFVPSDARGFPGADRRLRRVCLACSAPL